MNGEDNISTLVDRLTRKGTLAITSPETMQRLLVEQKENITQSHALPTEEALTNLFEYARKNASKIADQLIPCPLAEGTFLYLYDQIKACALFGLFGSAITNCGMLVEFALKLSIHYVETNGDSQNGINWVEFEEITLGMAIKRAIKCGLLDATDQDKYIGFKNDIRNPYSHFNIHKQTEGVVFPNVKVFNIDTGETEEKDVEANSNLMLQVLAKQEIDKQTFHRIFEISDALCQHIVSKSFHIINESKISPKAI